MTKRTVKQNVWGNWKGYEGRRIVEDFGTDEMAAKEWADPMLRVSNEVRRSVTAFRSARSVLTDRSQDLTPEDITTAGTVVTTNYARIEVLRELFPELAVWKEVGWE